MAGGAPKNNDNAHKGAVWRDAIRYELAKIGREIPGDDPAFVKGARACAGKFLDKVMEGDLSAAKELGDRLDGKPKQTTELSGPDGGEIPLGGTVKFVGSDRDKS